MESGNSHSTLNKSVKYILLIIGVLIIGFAGIQIYTCRLEQNAQSQIFDELKTRLAYLEQRPVKQYPADRAGLDIYRESNAKLQTPSKKEKRVVFLGDSITDRWDEEQNGRFFPERPYINRGIGGQTTAQMLVRFRPDVIALNPKAVVILAGINDLAVDKTPNALETIKNNLASMAESAQTHHVRVVLASLLPVGSKFNEEQEGELSERITGLNRWIKEYADRNDFTYLDYYSAMSDGKGFLADELSEDDGLHPNAKGYLIMTPLAEKAINSALGIKAK